MSQVRRSTRAKADLRSIHEYIATHNPPAAARVLRTIAERLDLIARNPKMGRSRPDIAPAVRYIPVGRYNVYYMEFEGGIEVVRILHSARDQESAFTG